jgi:hypothetical protein
MARSRSRSFEKPMIASTTAGTPAPISRYFNGLRKAGNGAPSRRTGITLMSLSSIRRVSATSSSARTQLDAAAFSDHTSTNVSNACSASSTAPGIESPALISHSSNQTSVPTSLSCAPMRRAISVSRALCEMKMFRALRGYTRWAPFQALRILIGAQPVARLARPAETRGKRRVRR